MKYKSGDGHEFERLMVKIHAGLKDVSDGDAMFLVREALAADLAFWSDWVGRKQIGSVGGSAAKNVLIAASKLLRHGNFKELTDILKECR